MAIVAMIGYALGLVFFITAPAMVFYIIARLAWAAAIPIALVALFFLPTFIADGTQRATPELTQAAKVYTETGVLPEGSPPVRKISLLDQRIQDVKYHFGKSTFQGVFFICMVGITFLVPFLNVFMGIGFVASVLHHIYTYYDYVVLMLFG